MIKGAVFDMDGLMFDTETLVYNAWQKVMDDHNYKYDFEIFKQTLGKRTVDVKKMYEEMYDNNFVYATMREEANVYFRKAIADFGVPIKKGLINLLEHLKSKGIKIALATSTSSQTTMWIMGLADLKKYFNALVCGNMVTNGKPHPEVFLTAAKELQLDPQDCIALEDSINGIKSAYNAGMKPIMVPDMLEPTDEIKPMLYALCNDLDEVIQYFN